MAAVSLLYEAAVRESVARSARIAIMHAMPDPALPDLMQAAEVVALQEFRETALLLRAQGLEPVEALQGRFDLVLIHASKNRRQTLGWVAEASGHLKPGGCILLAAANAAGARGLESRLGQAFTGLESRSAAKCRLMRMRPDRGCSEEVLQQWRQDARMRRLEATGLYSMPGLFSWDRIDNGSALLLRHLPASWRGCGMDLCCGNGLLARHIIASNAGIDCLHLVDHQRSALHCAEKNLEGSSVPVRYHWLDAASEPLPAGLDWIVCNPPFHRQQQRDVGLGQRILMQGCRALKRGGEIWLVANRKLPYERMLDAALARCEVLTQAQGFKIIRGIR